MARKRNLTSQIRPSTRNAILDFLAAVADGIIELRMSPWQRFRRWFV